MKKLWLILVLCLLPVAALGEGAANPVDWRILGTDTMENMLIALIEAADGERVLYVHTHDITTNTYTTRRTAPLPEDAELEAAQMYAPMLAMRNQFCCVSVISKLHPQWRYDVWVDYLRGGELHDIQSPFIGAVNADEAAVRDTLRSGTLKTAGEIRRFFQESYGPEESWSAALLEWAETECALYQE